MAGIENGMQEADFDSSDSNGSSDEETYATKKAQWIEQNGAKYDKMSTAKESKNAETIRAKERKEFINQKN